jgi:hypothetical protein
MAAARGLTAAELLARQLAQGRKVKKDQEQEAAQKAANDPAVWASEVRKNALAKSAKEEERARERTAAFVETEKAQLTVEKLSAKMQLLGLDDEALTGDVLDKVWELLSKAGMQKMPGRNQAEKKAELRYHLLEAMTAVMHTDMKLVLDTCVYPVKEILEQPNGRVVLIVTLPHGEQCTKTQVVSALRNLGEDVQVANVAIRMSTTPTTAKTKTRGKAENPFAPTIEIQLQGGGGLTPNLIEAIKKRQLVFTTDEGTRIGGIVTVRSMYALEIHFNAHERAKIKTMWDILELLGLEAEGLNSLLTSGTRWGLEKVGLDKGLMCVRVTEERRVGDKVEPLRPSDIPKMPQHGGPLVLAYFATRMDRDRVEACGVLVDCWLGKQNSDCIVLGCGQIKATIADKVQAVGIEAACKLLRARVETQYAVPGQLIEKVNNLLDWASGVEVTQTQLANTMLQLYLSKECRRGHDITADFLATVVEAMSKELQVPMPEDQYRTALQRYRVLLTEAQEEVTRRRGALGPVTFVQFARLPSPDITGEERRLAFGKVLDQDRITQIVEKWLRRSLKEENKQFLFAEPVLTQEGWKVLWGRKEGVILAVQHLNQLSKGEIFDSNDDWRGAPAQLMIQERGSKVTVSVLSHDKTQRSRQQVDGIIIKEALQPPAAANAEMVNAIRSLVQQLEGLWVPKHINDEDGNQRPVNFTAQGLAQVTRMSELPQPSAAQPFHIRSLYKHAGVSEVQCEDALQVLMQLQKTNEVQAVPVGEQWFLFLPAAYAADAAMYIDEHGTAEALVVGESVRDWCVSVATMTFLKQVRRVVRDGLWFPFRMANDGHVYEHVEPRPVDTVRSQEERWYDEIGPITNTALGRMKDTTLIAAAFNSKFNHEAPRLVVHTVGQNYSLVLFENSVFQEAMTQQPLRVGLPLSATFPTVPEKRLMHFYEWMCETVQGRLMKWKAHEGEVGTDSECTVFEHLPTLRILEQQRTKGESTLFLTPPQAQDLANAIDSSRLKARPILRAQAGTGYYTPEKETRGVWVVTQSNPNVPATTLDQCRIEWSKNFCLDTDVPNSGWPRGGTLYSVIAEAWPELTHGRIVANMLHELGVRNLLFVLKANTGVMIVLPEVIFPGRVATLEQQFGEGTATEDFLDSLDTITPLMLQHGLEMEQAVARKSAGALHQAVTQLLKGVFVLSGVQVQVPESGCKGPQAEKLFGQFLIDGRWLPTKPEIVHPSIKMETLAHHPAMRDWRGPRKLLLVIARLKEEFRPRMIPVGAKGTSILFLPRTTQHNFLTWNYDDLRFGQWNPARKDPLEVLARMELTIENDTDLNKPKSSGKHRSRDESAGEDEGGGKKSMNKGAPAGGGESTSVHMDE